MQVGFGPFLLSLAALMALAACARGAHPQGGPASAGATQEVSPPAVASTLSPSAGGPTSSAGDHCPAEAPLDPGADPMSMATAAATAAVPQRYPPRIDITGFQVTNAYPADPAAGYGAIAYGLCGNDVGQRTWVVELSFPKMLPSIDLSSGQLFLSRFAGGWKVWFQYH